MSQKSSDAKNIKITAILTLVAAISTFAVFTDAYSQNSDGVMVENAHLDQSTINVGENFTITATLVNNSPNVISVHNNCISPFSADFDSHAELQVLKPCIYFAISKQLNPGENMTVTGPGANVAYRAVVSGQANATITFNYSIVNQTSLNMTSNPSVSKSILFTVSPGAGQTGQKVPEFPFAMVVLFIGIISTLAIARLKWNQISSFSK